MNTPVVKLEDPADVLLEFIETLAKISSSPEKIEQNSESMIGASGELIIY
jgi:hypothetical protein